MGGLEKGAAKEEIKFSDLLDVDAVIATHLTKGAFDGEARRLIPRDVYKRQDIGRSKHVQRLRADNTFGLFLHPYVCFFKGAAGNRFPLAVCEKLAAFDRVSEGKVLYGEEGFTLMTLNNLP